MYCGILDCDRCGQLFFRGWHNDCPMRFSPSNNDRPKSTPEPLPSESENPLHSTTTKASEVLKLMPKTYHDVVIVTGGRDRYGRYLMVFPYEKRSIIGYQEILPAFLFHCLPSREECVNNVNGYTVILERPSNKSDTKNLVKYLNKELKDKLKQILIVHINHGNIITELNSAIDSLHTPNKQTISQSHTELEFKTENEGLYSQKQCTDVDRIVPVHIPAWKLHKYAALNQLPQELINLIAVKA